MSITLNATLREDQGKGASRRLRHAKQLPAIVYGGKKDPASIALFQKDVQHKLPDESFYSQVLSLDIDGTTEDVLIRDIQHHPYKIDVLHMDFVRVDANKPVHVHSQLHFIGEEVSPGVKTENGAISHVIIEVELECLPKNIPDHIEVDLSEMHVGDVIHLSDLKLPEGVELLALKHGEDNDAVVASMHVHKVIEDVEEETPEAAAEEGGEEAAADEGDDKE